MDDGLYANIRKDTKNGRDMPLTVIVTVIVVYGDGSVLQLWDQPETKRANGHCLFLHYTDVDGKVYSYINYKLTLDTIVTRYLMYDNVEIDT